MNPLLAFVLGVVTPFALWGLFVVGGELGYYIRHHWLDTVEWRSDRAYKRWEWGNLGRAVAFTFKRWPRKGIVVTVRPWRPIVPAKRPSMADDIRRIELPVIDESYNVPSRGVVHIPNDDDQERDLGAGDSADQEAST